jgi:hypothetical protein
MIPLDEWITSREIQWETLQVTKEGFPDVQRAIEMKSDDYKSTLISLSQGEAEIMRNSMAEVCETVDQGFKHLVFRLERLESRMEDSLTDLGDRLSQDLSQIREALDWGFSMIISQLDVTNILAENVALLLRIPDMQKERRYYIEQGLKHYKNAARDKDLYSDALKNLLKAETLEETDYFVLFHIGLVHLYSPDISLCDFDKAAAYFQKAGKYAAVECDPDAFRLADLLTANPRAGSLRGQQPSNESVQRFAADCYRQVAMTRYVQGRFQDAREHSEKAASLAPHHLEALFTHAKMLAAVNQEERGAEVLSGAIERDRAYALKGAMDPDLGTKTAVLAKLEEHRLRAREAASAAISKAKSEVSSFANLLSETRALNVSPAVAEECLVKADKLIEQAQLLFQRKTFFALLESAEACNFAAARSHKGRQACIATLAHLQSNWERKLDSLKHQRESADQAMKDLKHALKAAVDPDLGIKAGVREKLEEHRLRAKEAASAAISKAQEELSYLAFLWARARQANVALPSTEECRLHSIDNFIKEAQALFSCQTFFSLLDSAEACNAAMKLCQEVREACIATLRRQESDLQRKLSALHQRIIQNMNVELRRERLKEDADILVKALEGSYRFSGGLGCILYFASYSVYSIVVLFLSALANAEGAIPGILMLLGLPVSAVPVIAISSHYEEKRKAIPKRQKKIRRKLEEDTRRMEQECSDYIEARFAREGKELQSTLQAVQDILAGGVPAPLAAGDGIDSQEAPSREQPAAEQQTARKTMREQAEEMRRAYSKREARQGR